MNIEVQLLVRMRQSRYSGGVVKNTIIHRSNFMYYPINAELVQLVDELIRENNLPITVIVD